VKILLRAGILCALAAVAFADKVVLKNGKTYEGTIVEQTDAVVKIRTAKASLTFQMDQVASVEKGEWTVGELEKRLAALDPAKPAGYLEAAKYMAGPAREGFELPLFKQLCEIASSLDKQLAYEAQTLLAKELKASGDKRALAHAWRRALVARPKDAEATRELEPLNAEFVKVGQFQLRNLAEALDLVLSDTLDQAAPKLQAVDPTLLPDDIFRELKMPIEKFAADIRSRVRCKTCLGLPKIKCPGCQTPGEMPCTTCAGKGRTPAAVEKNDPNEKFAEAVCLACFGTGMRLCVECKATRPFLVEFKPEGKKSRKPVRITVQGGHEMEELEKILKTKTWQSREDGLFVSAIVAEKVLTGGEIVCPECKGAVFAPPQSPVEHDPVKATLDAANLYIDGTKTWDPLGFEPAAFDQDAVRDGCFRRQKGKWVK
jgi:hypothetical protein